MIVAIVFSSDFQQSFTLECEDHSVWFVKVIRELDARHGDDWTTSGFNVIDTLIEAYEQWANGASPAMAEDFDSEHPDSRMQILIYP
ncbi:hypothetical protein EBZ80_15875 [bacterium]|nr:hypothetical protein [bacterium]